MTYTSTAWMLGLALAWLTAGGGGQTKGGDPRALKNPVPSTPASIAAGRKLYQTNCRHCHGAKGLGDGPMAPTNPSPANLTDATWEHGSSDGEIFTLIRNGAGPNSEMKGMRGTLTDTNIWQVVNYLRSIGPKAPAP